MLLHKGCIQTKCFPWINLELFLLNEKMLQACGCFQNGAIVHQAVSQHGRVKHSV